MTNSPANFSPLLSPRISCSVLACILCASVLLGGCSVRKKPSIAWGTAIMVKPVVPLRSAQPAEDPLAGAPDLQVELTPSARSPFPRTQPPRPRASAASSAAGDTGNSDVPLLAPQLSVEETANAQRETGQSIAAAEKNIAATRGRSLNSTQTDLASKVRGFIADAKDAARVSDWDRARSLAKKAQVLSQELVSSL
jgi:hypothetical protein